MDREMRTVTGGFFCFRLEAEMGRKYVNGVTPVFSIRLDDRAMGILKDLAKEQKAENLSTALRSLIYEASKDDQQVKSKQASR